jgi:hypothetical protein
MDRGAYAKRLTGQVSGNMPVLKPRVSPFHMWTKPPLAGSQVETGVVPPRSRAVLERTPETAALAATFSPGASFQMKPAPALLSPPHSSESQTLNPPSAPRSVNKAETRQVGEQRIAHNKAQEPLIAQLNSSLNSTTVEGPKIDQAVPKFRSMRRRAVGSQHSEQQDTIETSDATPAPENRERRPAVVSLLNAKRSREEAEVASATTGSLEPVDGRRATLADPVKPALELQPRKNAADGELAAPPHRPAKEPQARTTSGVHIGTLEVRIVPAGPAPPIIKPRRAPASSATIISRSFISPLGLSQGQ